MKQPENEAGRLLAAELAAEQAGNAFANQSNRGPDLRFISMSIVRLLANADLTWTDREECAMALTVTYHAWQDLLKESQGHAQAMATATTYQS
jgi:hypothetical protein